MRTRLPFPRRLAPSLLLSLLVAACGGAGTGGTGLPTATATILFPPPVSLTTASLVTVRGVSTAPEEIAAIYVNGRSVDTTDGHATWQVRAKLDLGANDLRVDIETTTGIVLTDATVGAIRRSPVLISNASSVDRNPTTGEVYVHDRYEGLLGYSEPTSTWTRVSSEEPLGPSYASGAIGGAFDGSTNAYYVLSRGALVRIDVQTGLRTPVTGTGPSLASTMDDIDCDHTGHAYVVGSFFDLGSDALLRVDLLTGNRDGVSSDTLGTGTPFGKPVAVHVPAAGGAAYVYDRTLRALFEVELSTGNRTVLMDHNTATGSVPSGADALYVDPGTTRAYVAYGSRIYLLDWTAGTVALSFRRSPGYEGQVGGFEDMVLGTGGRMLVVDRPDYYVGWAGLGSVDLGAGTFTQLLDTAVGSGPGAPQADFSDIVVDPARLRLLLLDRAGHLHGLDPSTGVRSVVSSDTVGSGPEIGSVGEDTGLVLDGGDTAYVSGEDTIFSVDASTGARSLVSEDGVRGSGPLYEDTGGLAWDPGAAKVLGGTAEDDVVLRVDPATGDRVPLTSVVMLDLHDMDRDGLRDRLYLATETDSDGYLLRTVALATGTVTPFLFLDDDPLDGLDSVKMMAADLETGRLFVHQEATRIYEVDATTADPTVLTDIRDIGDGPPTRTLHGMTAAPHIGVLFLLGEGCVLALDAETGERVLIAK